MFIERNDCRLCGAPITKVLDLGESCLANELLDDPRKSLNQDRFPLYLAACVRCNHVQMPVAVNPDRLFCQYPYVSGTSPVFIDHLRRAAAKLTNVHNLKPGDFVLEIGSNDGTLLKAFDAYGMKTVGVDPAKNLATKANDEGILTIPEFFTLDLAKKIKERFGPARLVVANNVFAHADDLSGIVQGVSHLIGETGSFVFEVAYLIDMVKQGIWDTIYHEHVAFHHIRPLMAFFERHGMVVTHVERVNTQGGSIRVTACRSTPYTRVDEALYEFLAQEPDGPVSLSALERSIFKLRMEFHSREVFKGKTVAIYGVPAKVATFCAVLGITDKMVDYAVDSNPLKHGKFIPGTRIPIFHPDHLKEVPPTTVLISAWNFQQSIRERHKDLKCRWVVPFLGSKPLEVFE